jgi:hypothetical protein
MERPSQQNQPKEKTMSYPAHEVQGAIDSLNELITENSAAFTTAGLTPANVKTALTAQGVLVTQKDTAQENAKTALKTATGVYNTTATTAYNFLSSTVDMLAGAVGKTTPLAKQIYDIRHKLTASKHTGGGSSSSSSSDSSSSSSSSSSS